MRSVVAGIASVAAVAVWLGLMAWSDSEVPVLRFSTLVGAAIGVAGMAGPVLGLYATARSYNLLAAGEAPHPGWQALGLATGMLGFCLGALTFTRAAGYLLIALAHR